MLHNIASVALSAADFIKNIFFLKLSELQKFYPGVVIFLETFQYLFLLKTALSTVMLWFWEHMACS